MLRDKICMGENGWEVRGDCARVPLGNGSNQIVRRTNKQIACETKTLCRKTHNLVDRERIQNSSVRFDTLIISPQRIFFRVMFAGSPPKVRYTSASPLRRRGAFLAKKKCPKRTSFCIVNFDSTFSALLPVVFPPKKKFWFRSVLMFYWQFHSFCEPFIPNSQPTTYSNRKYERVQFTGTDTPLPGKAIVSTHACWRQGEMTHLSL